MADTSLGATYNKRKARRGYSTVLAKDPHDGGEWDLLLSPTLEKSMVRTGQGRVNEFIHIVRNEILRPKYIYRGVRDDDDESIPFEDDWLCYITRPAFAYDWKRNVRVDAYDDEVLLIYVNDERVIYHWFWVDCDPDQPNLPINHSNRFREPCT